MRFTGFPDWETGEYWPKISFLIKKYAIKMPVNECGYPYSIKLIIQLVILVQLGDAVGILTGGDCKFYITAFLQLC